MDTNTTNTKFSKWTVNTVNAFRTSGTINVRGKNSLLTKDNSPPKIRKNLGLHDIDRTTHKTSCSINDDSIINAFRTSGTINVQDKINLPENNGSKKIKQNLSGLIDPDRITCKASGHLSDDGIMIMCKVPFINKQGYCKFHSYLSKTRSKSDLNIQSIAINENLNPQTPTETQNYVKDNKPSYKHLSSNGALPVKEINNVKWISSPDMITLKLDFNNMESELGIEYTKNLIYSIVNDDFGHFCFTVQGVLEDANNYLYINN